MKSLPQPINEGCEGQGNGVVSKTSNIDQAHGQENRNVTGLGGCIGQKILLPSGTGDCRNNL